MQKRRVDSLEPASITIALRADDLLSLAMAEAGVRVAPISVGEMRIAVSAFFLERDKTMTKHTLKCATCGKNLKLTDQIVSCGNCKRKGEKVYSGSLAATILTIESQAFENGRTLDIQSLRADGKGDLTFSFIELPEGAVVLDRSESKEARKRLA